MSLSESSDTELSKLLPNNLKYSRRSHRSRGSVISFHNIHYTVQVEENRKKVDKLILSNVSGIFKPGLNAILGPTGGGKTTLLDILASRKEPEGLQGTVLINGAPPHPNFRLTSGYVLQDDVLMGTLTVRENLTFCAALRLPGYYTKQQRSRRVDEIIAELGLKDCANTKVGTDRIRGISGGERKRTCVGMELMIKPAVLFLDEPTTGLDASTAMSVMHLLERLSHRGRNIILSIHQPRFGIFRLFTRVHLLGKGETVYHGPAEECLQYFNSLGFECDKHDNPADFFLDVILNETRLSSSLLRDEPGTPTSVSAGYRHSMYSKQLEDELKAIHDRYNDLSSEPVEFKDTGYLTSWFVQFRWLCWRNLSMLYRHPVVIQSLYLVSLFFSLLAGAIFFQVESTATSGIQDRLGALFFIQIICMRQGQISMVMFMEEKLLFRHETASGYYRVSTYFLAKLVANDILQRMIPTICIAAIVYPMIGFRPGFIPFLEFTLNMLTTTYAICSQGILLGLNVRTLGLGNILFAFYVLLQVLFAGFLINVNSIIPWLQVLQYLSISRYSLNAASIIELKDREFCNPFPDNTTCVSGNEYLENAGIDYSTWGLWSTQVAMATICFIFWCFCYLALRRMRKNKA